MLYPQGENQRSPNSFTGLSPQVEQLRQQGFSVPRLPQMQIKMLDKAIEEAVLEAYWAMQG